MRRKTKGNLGKKILSICICTSMVLCSAVPNIVRASDQIPEESVPVIGDTIVTNDGTQDNLWKLVWQDEFNGTELDTTKWGYQVGDGSTYGIAGWGNSEQQYYTDDGNNVSFEDGKLVITAKKNYDSNKYQGATYTSGRIWTKGFIDASEQGTPALFTKKYGRFEAKISMPEGTGYWPAFWMMPAYDKYGGWALSGEIDIMEARGRLLNQVGGTLHYGGSWPNNKYMGDHYTEESFRITDEHVYALEWLPGVMRWYVDDILYYETRDWYSKRDGNPVNYTYPAPFDQEFYLMLNLAVGGNYDGGQLDTTLDNRQMKIDYVRVYDLEGQTYDENVLPPAVLPDPLPEGVAIGSNLITGTFDAIHKVTSDYANNSTNGWDLVCLPDFSGDAIAEKQEDDSARIAISSQGNQTYSIQMIHKLPLTKGYRYKVSFDAKADASRTLEIKVANPINFSLYSDVVNATLSTSYKTHQFTFDMSKDSTTGRLELNMGLSNIPVSIKNVKVEVLELIGDVSEDAPKPPLTNGEHIYNGTFDQGNATRMQFWRVVGATGNVTALERALKLSSFDVFLSDSFIEQVGLNLLKNDTYQVKFNAKSEHTGTVKLELLSEDGMTVYGSKEYEIGSTMTPCELTFTMGTDTDEMSKLRIYVGGNTDIITLDDISMKRLTDNNVSYEGVKIYPVGNGDFSAGTAGWTVSQTDYAVESENGENVCYAVGARCINNYDKMLMYPGVDIAKGLNYTMKFKARTSSDQTQTPIIRIQREGGDWASVLDTSFDITKEWKEYTYNFTAGFSGNLGLKYLLGAFSENCRFYVKDVELYVANKPLLQGAFFVSSQSAPKVSEDIILKYYEKSGWENAENIKFFINNVPVDSSLVSLNKEAKTVTLRSELFDRAGAYTIQATADGYDSTNALVQSVMESSGNLVVNGSFDNGTEGWGTYFQNGCGSIDATEKNARVHFIWHEGNTWDLQLYQENIPVEGGKSYVLEFDASATIRRPFTIELGVKNGANPLSTAVLEKDISHYKFRYDSPVSGGTKLNFLLGNVTKGDLITSNQNNPHDIIFDNIVIREMTPEELSKVTPEMIVKQTIKLGEDSILTHSIEAAWNEAPKTVYINGEAVPSNKVTYYEDSAILDKSLFLVVGNYKVVIKAAGMDDTIEVTQVVIGSDGEFIKNGTFEDFSSWGSWFMNEDKTGSLVVSEGKIAVTSAGQSSETWAIQVFQESVPVSKGVEYTLTFDAKSTQNHQIVVQCAGQADKTFIITTTPQKYSWTFTSAINGTKLNFLLATKEAENNVYTIELDKISIKRSSDVVVTPTPTPEVTPSPTPEVTPTVTPTKAPEVTPTPMPEVTPTVTPTPIVIPTVTPSPTPMITPTTVPTPEQVRNPVEVYIYDGAAKIVLNMDASFIELPEEFILSQLRSNYVDKVIIEVNTKHEMLPNYVIKKEVLEAAVKNNKDIYYVVKDSLGTVLYELKLDANNLAKGTITGELSLGVDIGRISNNKKISSILLKDKNNTDGLFLDFTQSGELPAQIEMKLFVGKDYGFKALQKLYLYSVNSNTGMLEPVPFGTTYRVDKDGYVEIPIIKGNEYVLLKEKVSKEGITPTKDLIQVENELTLNQGKKQQVLVSLPITLERVESFTKKALFSAKGRVAIAYQSSDEEIAIIDENGTITAKSQGIVTITTKVKLYYGATYTYQTKVIIK